MKSKKQFSAILSSEAAIAIAVADAKQFYRDLTVYEIEAQLIGDVWNIDFILKDPLLDGGGPQYVISGISGEIVKRTLLQ